MPSFGTDGVRGIANTELTPELALALGRVVARRLVGDAFLVGRDTRRSGPLLQAALSAGLASGGSNVIDLGVVPTPGLAYLCATRGEPGAMVSASHNPFEDNGIKLISDAGTKLADSLERAIEADLEGEAAARPLFDASARAAPARPFGAAVGTILAEPGVLAAYVDHLVAVAGAGAGRLADAGLRVVLDCANGAASSIAPQVLERLGVSLEVMNAAPDGCNINAGCGSTHLEGLAERVVSSGADLGLAFDGDADRVLAADEAGRIVDGDELICMFALDLARRRQLFGGAVVVSVMSNLGLHRSLTSHGIDVIQTPVGDRYVVDSLEANGLVLGGEQSGHLVFRAEATTGDGILTAIKLLELVARKSLPLGEIAREAMTRLPQVLRSIPMASPERIESSAVISQVVQEARRALGDRGRVLVRASGTEPLVRVMAEAETHELAIAVVEEIVAVAMSELSRDLPFDHPG